MEPKSSAMRTSCPNKVHFTSTAHKAFWSWTWLTGFSHCTKMVHETSPSNFWRPLVEKGVPSVIEQEHFSCNLKKFHRSERLIQGEPRQVTCRHRGSFALEHCFMLKIWIKFGFFFFFGGVLVQFGLRIKRWENKETEGHQRRCHFLHKKVFFWWSSHN